MTIPPCRNPMGMGASAAERDRQRYGAHMMSFPRMHKGMGELTVGQTVWTGLTMASVALSAYHGYRRNRSVGWAIVWGLLGGLAPVITPAIAVAQGFGERAR